MQGYRVQEFRLSSPPSFKCNVLRESLSVDQSKYSLRNTKERGVVGNLYVSLVRMIHIWGKRKDHETIYVHNKFNALLLSLELAPPPSPPPAS